MTTVTLPKSGPVCYADAQSILEYRLPMVGSHLPGVRDVGLWTTDQMRAYAQATADAWAEKLDAARAQPAAECKAGGACRWRGNASAEFETAHRAAQPADEPAFPHCKQCGSSAWMCSVCPQPAAQPAAEPLTDEQIDMMWRRAGIANNARGAFFAGVAAGANTMTRCRCVVNE